MARNLGERSGRSYKNQQLHLTTEECLQFFEKTRGQETYYDNLFSDNEKLNVYYEDFLQEKDATLTTIQEFLEVPRSPLSTGLVKQGSRRRSQTVANFDELKSCFENTKWDYLFQ